jgi:hypothetical protein
MSGMTKGGRELREGSSPGISIHLPDLMSFQRPCDFGIDSGSDRPHRSCPDPLCLLLLVFLLPALPLDELAFFPLATAA